MGVEIERKFLLANNHWRTENIQGILYRQGYLGREKERTVRIRVAGKNAYLTIKGISQGAQRLEFEYEIPLHDANEMMHTMCIKPLIEKYRYKIQHSGLIWEIDEFLGDNAGLILAEVELQHPEQNIILPDWIGTEVTGDPGYYNANLIKNPYKNWDKS